MADFKLNAQTPLSGARFEIDGATIEEVASRALLSVAIAPERRDALASVIEAAWQTRLPDVGKSNGVRAIKGRLLALALDQIWIEFEQAGADLGANPGALIGAAIGNAGYIVDQSDAWANVRLSGPKSRDVLERICMLDLDDDAFPAGAVARTRMAHIAVIMIRDDAETYTLLSPRSSALSFWHAVETSLRNIA